MATRLMNRLFSAEMNHEDEILNQVQNDAEIALEDGTNDTNEIRYDRLDGGLIEATDKGNGEVTLMSIGDNCIKLESK